jgi:hypothetical protein
MATADAIRAKQALRGEGGTIVWRVPGSIEAASDAMVINRAA